MEEENVGTAIYCDNFERNAIARNTNYQYEVLTAKYLHQVIDVFTHTFCSSEPMTSYLHMEEEKFRIFTTAVAEKAVADQLSVVALDGDKVIAFALMEDLAIVGELPEFDPKFKYILGLLEKLGADFFPGKEFPVNHIAHLFITAVDKNYRHCGLSAQVNFAAMDLAAARGFDFIYCEFTNFFNEKGTVPRLRNRKKWIGSQLYADFEFEDKFKPFEYLQGGANSFLWEVHPEAELKYKENGKLFVGQI